MEDGVTSKTWKTTIIFSENEGRSQVFEKKMTSKKCNQKQLKMFVALLRVA